MITLDDVGYLPESLIIKTFLVLGWSPKVPLEYDPFEQRCRALMLMKRQCCCVHFMPLSSMAALCRRERVARAFQVQDLPVTIPMERLEARVKRMVHRWNTAKRTALQNKRGHVGEVAPFLSCVIVAALRCVIVTGLNL